MQKFIARENSPWSQQNKLVDLYTAAKILNLSPAHIRRWEKKGLLLTIREKTGNRLFRLKDLESLRSGNKSTSATFQILRTDERSQYTVIELFSGSGGMALGFENAGLTTQLLVEIDKDCVSTLRHNRPDWNVIHNDIRDVAFTDYSGTVDIVAGGFPCQAFSYAGHSRGFEDTRGTLFFSFARCVQEVKPKLALAENVRGLLRHDSGRTLETMIQVLEDIGYKVAYKLLRSQFLDVPQKRERLIIIGVRQDLDLDILFPQEQNHIISLREAFKNCPNSPCAQYPKRKREILSCVPEGGYWKDLPLDLQKEYMKGSFHLSGGKTGMARRLSWDEPSLTLTCSPAQKQTERCHPSETRPLSIREYARIQSFPDEWGFLGSVASQYKQIGNAVPVNLAYHVGKCLIDTLDNRGQEFTLETNTAGIVQQLSLPL
ncbi:MAG: DNA (cytosine-5-)-methyltransferase [Cyanobacteria bacterium J06638_20]